MIQKNRLFDRAAISAAALCLAVTSAGAQTVIEDGTFDLAADWTLHGPFIRPEGSTGADVQASQQVEFNNAFLRFGIAHPTVASGSSQAWGILINDTREYGPGRADSGSIDEIRFDFTARVSPGGRLDRIVSLAVEQDGYLWAALDRRVFFSNTGWLAMQIDELVASDFVPHLWEGSVQPPNPDFSENGSPLTFGILTGTSCPDTSDCSNFLLKELDLDNWRVTITPIAPGSIRFSRDNYIVREADGAATLNVLREDGVDGIISVPYRTLDGTATGGADYEIADTTIDIADGEDTVDIVIPVFDDTDLEGGETFSVELMMPSGDATLATPSSAIVTITDNEGVDLAVELTAAEPRGNQSLDPEIQIDYTLTVRNLGLQMATGVTVAVSFEPGELGYISDDAGGFYDPVTAIWTVDTLAGGEERTLQRLTYRKVDSVNGGDVVMNAHAILDQVDDNPADNDVSLTVAAGGADIYVELSDEVDPVAAGVDQVDPAFYNLTLGNATINAQAAEDLVMIFNVIGNIEEVDPMPPECAVVLNGDQLRCEYASFAGLVEFRIEVDVAGGQTITASAVAFHSSFDPDPDNQDVSEQTRIENPTITPTQPTGIPGPSADSCDNAGPISGLLSGCMCTSETIAAGTSFTRFLPDLRRFRDQQLMPTAPGRAFVGFYYRQSPAVAAWLGPREWAKALVRSVLTPVVYSIRYPAIPYAMAGLLLLLIGWRVGRRLVSRSAG